MTEELLQPDAAARRRAVLAIFLCAAAGVLAYYWANTWLGSWRESLKEDPESALQQMRILLDWLALANAVFIVVVSGYLAYFAYRIRTAGRYPPPGVKVVRPTRVQKGPDARIAARMTILIALLLLVLGMGLSWFLHVFLDLFLGAG